MRSTGTADSGLLREDADGVAILTLNRPERRNALTVPLLEGLVHELDAVAGSGQIHAVVLTGAGGGFCAGADMQEFALTPDDPGRQRRLDLVTETITRLRTLPQPSVAAVAGPAYGAGWGLSLACDITYAAADATFCLPEVAKGLRLPEAITTRLAEVVGPVRAAGIVLSGDRHSGSAGLAGGWVAQTLPDAAAVEASALALARSIAGHPPETIQHTTSVLRRATYDLPTSRQTTEQRGEL